MEGTHAPNAPPAPPLFSPALVTLFACLSNIPLNFLFIYWMGFKVGGQRGHWH